MGINEEVIFLIVVVLAQLVVFFESSISFLLFCQMDLNNQTYLIHTVTFYIQFQFILL